MRLREGLAFVSSSPFVRSFLKLMAGSGLSQVIPLLLSPLLARQFTPDDIGGWSVFASVILAVSAVASWRYHLAILLPDNADEARSVLGAATHANIATSLAILFVTAFFADPLARLLGEPGLSTWFYLLAPAIFLVTQIQTFTFWLNRNGEYGSIGKARSIQALLLTPSQVALGLAGLGMSGLMAGSMTGYLGGFCYLAAKTWREFPYRQKLRDTRSVMKRHWRMPVLNGPNAVADAIRLNGLNIAIAAAFGQASLGQYSMAWRVVQSPLLLINGSLSQLYFQKLATTRRGRMRDTVLRMVAASAALGVIPFAVIFLYVEPLFIFVFGDEWRQAGEIASLLTPWLYLNFITAPISTLFLVAERQAAMLWFSVGYMALPFAVLIFGPSEFEDAIRFISWSMALALIILLILADRVSRRFDGDVVSLLGARADQE